MMMKYEIRIILNIDIEPKIDNKKFETDYFNKVIKIAYNQSKVVPIICSVINKINKLNFDINDRDLGKSGSFKSHCLEVYSPELESQ